MKIKKLVPVTYIKSVSAHKENNENILVENEVIPCFKKLTEKGCLNLATKYFGKNVIVTEVIVEKTQYEMDLMQFIEICEQNKNEEEVN